MKRRVRIYVEGRVQGVFYRASTVRTAQQLNVTGYAKNLPNGGVEVVAEGEAEQVDGLINWCRQGPRHSIVERSHVVEEVYQGEFADFSVH